MTIIRAWMSLNFGIISPPITELAALDRLIKQYMSAVTQKGGLTYFLSNFCYSAILKI